MQKTITQSDFLLHKNTVSSHHLSSRASTTSGRLIFIFIIQHAMTKSFKFGICNLTAELLTHALRICITLTSAWTVSPGLFKTFSDSLGYFLVRIFNNPHILFSPSPLYPIQLIKSIRHTVFSHYAADKIQKCII